MLNWNPITLYPRPLTKSMYLARSSLDGLVLSITIGSASARKDDKTAASFALVLSSSRLTLEWVLENFW